MSDSIDSPDKLCERCGAFCTDMPHLEGPIYCNACLTKFRGKLDLYPLYNISADQRQSHVFKCEIEWDNCIAYAFRASAIALTIFSMTATHPSWSLNSPTPVRILHWVAWLSVSLFTLSVMAHGLITQILLGLRGWKATYFEFNFDANSIQQTLLLTGTFLCSLVAIERLLSSELLVNLTPQPIKLPVLILVGFVLLTAYSALLIQIVLHKLDVKSAVKKSIEYYLAQPSALGHHFGALVLWNLIGLTACGVGVSVTIPLSLALIALDFQVDNEVRQIQSEEGSNSDASQTTQK